MSNTETAEQKLTKLKCTLLLEIASSKSNIFYHIKEAVKDSVSLLQTAKSEGETRILTDEAYRKILDYLLCIERDAMYKFKDRQYLSSYYEQIDIKENILKSL